MAVHRLPNLDTLIDPRPERPPALPEATTGRITTDEFLETLRHRVLIPVVDAHAADVRLEVARDLPVAMDGCEADRLWLLARDEVESRPAGSRLRVRVFSEAGLVRLAVAGSSGTIGALMLRR